MLARVASFAIVGVESRRVWVEADVRPGLPAFTVVGLADNAVREARERVRAALVNSGFEFPLKRITINLAPAYLRKIGPGFDLPLALAVLAASEQLAAGTLDGLRRRGRAVARAAPSRRCAASLAMAEGARRHGLARLVVPVARAREAALVPGVTVLGGGEPAARGGGPPRRRAAGRPAAGPRAGARLGRSDPGDRPLRRPGSQRAHPGARDRRRRRAQPAPPWPARHRQDHARPPAGHDPAAARSHRGAGGHARPLRRGPARGRRPGVHAPLPLAAPHDLRLRPRRRRLPAGARRGDPRPLRRPLPRRALRVLALEPRGDAPAARGRPGRDRPRPAGRRVPDAVHARRGHEPVPVRRRGRRLPLHGGRSRAAPPAAERARCSTGSISPSRSAARRPPRSTPRPDRPRARSASASSPPASARPIAWRPSG